MRSSAVLLVALLVAALAAGTASGVAERTSDTLRVNAKLAVTWKFGDEYCPEGKPVNVACVRFVGKGPIAGLGRARTTYVKTMESNGCRVTQFNEAMLTVPGRGSLTLTRPGKACGPTAPARVGPYTYTVSRGTGIYEGASGTLVYRGSAGPANFSCGPCGTGEDTWSGTITVPGLEFELTPPKIVGAVSRTVKAPRNAKGVRVEYTVTAQDAADGARPVTCKPRSGSTFRLGRTQVSCSAVDTNGNTARATFTITVKRG